MKYKEHTQIHPHIPTGNLFRALQLLCSCSSSRLWIQTLKSIKSLWGLITMALGWVQRPPFTLEPVCPASQSPAQTKEGLPLSLCFTTSRNTGSLRGALDLFHITVVWYFVFLATTWRCCELVLQTFEGERSLNSLLNLRAIMCGH